jgi:hypothetical protein
MVDRYIDPKTDIKVTGTDISARDNASLATAASTIIGSFMEMRDRQLIDDAELMRLAYRFAGEVVDVEDMLARGAAAPPPVIPPQDAAGGKDAGKRNGRKKKDGPRPLPKPGRPPGVKIDPITGEPKGIDRA